MHRDVRMKTHPDLRDQSLVPLLQVPLLAFSFN